MQIITEGYATGYRRLHITGGEPLLWKGLFESLDHAFGIGYQAVFLNTNGTLISDVLAQRLAGYYNLTISVSLDGFETLHDRLRGGNSYRRALRGIRSALDAGANIVIFTVATKTLLVDLPYFAESVYTKFPAIKRLTLIPLVNIRQNEAALSKEYLDPQDFLELVRAVALLNLAGLKSDVINEPLVNVAAKQLELPYIPQVLALRRKGSMIVMADRQICPAHSIPQSLGQYSPGMIQAVLVSDTYHGAVAPDDIICPTCKYIKMCRANGMNRPAEGSGKAGTKNFFCKSVLNNTV
jgi:MoaA/NifB/PqqE/SkfB family radical SAM enzyme